MAKAKIKRGIPVMLRKGGAHRKSKTGERQKLKNQLRKDILAIRKEGKDSCASL